MGSPGTEGPVGITGSPGQSGEKVSLTNKTRSSWWNNSTRGKQVSEFDMSLHTLG